MIALSMDSDIAVFGIENPDGTVADGDVLHIPDIDAKMGGKDVDSADQQVIALVCEDGGAVHGDDVEVAQSNADAVTDGEDIAAVPGDDSGAETAAADGDVPAVREVYVRGVQSGQEADVSAVSRKGGQGIFERVEIALTGFAVSHTGAAAARSSVRLRSCGGSLRGMHWYPDDNGSGRGERYNGGFHAAVFPFPVPRGAPEWEYGDERR